MAVPTMYIVESANLFIGDADPTASNHLELETANLPALEQPTVAHAPGGGVMSVDWAMDYIMPMTISYKLKGMNPDRIKMFGFGGQSPLNHTIYGVIRDKRSNRQLEAKAIINAMIIKAAPSSFARAQGIDYDYEAKQVTRYGLWIDGARVHDINYWTSEVWNGDTQVSATANAILRIPGTA